VKKSLRYALDKQHKGSIYRVRHFMAQPTLRFAKSEEKGPPGTLKVTIDTFFELTADPTLQKKKPTTNSKTLQEPFFAVQPRAPHWHSWLLCEDATYHNRIVKERFARLKLRDAAPRQLHPP